MSTHPVYDQLLAEITDELEHKVLAVLVERSDQKTSRQDMVRLVYGKDVAENAIGSCIEDRRIRECIERLRLTWPIVSSSSEKGYVLEDDEDKIKEFAAEQESRAEHSRHVARAAYNWLPRARSIREARRTAANVTQPSLL